MPSPMRKTETNDMPVEQAANWRDLLTPEQLAIYDAAGGQDSDELRAALDGPTIDSETGVAKKGSVRVSRDSREVTYKDGAHQGVNDNGTYRRTAANTSKDTQKLREEEELGFSEQVTAKPAEPRLRSALVTMDANADPAIREENATIISVVRGLAERRGICVVCGQPLSGDSAEKRVTIVIHDAEETEDRIASYHFKCFSEFHVPLEAPGDWQAAFSDRDLKIWHLHDVEGLSSRQIIEEMPDLVTGKPESAQKLIKRTVDKIRKARKAQRTPKKPSPRKPEAPATPRLSESPCSFCQYENGELVEPCRGHEPE